MGEVGMARVLSLSAVVLLLLTACADAAAPTPIPSDTIALIPKDFMHPVNVFESKPISCHSLAVCPVELTRLRVDEPDVFSHMSAYYTWLMEPGSHALERAYPQGKPKGVLVPDVVQHGAESWVMSFGSLSSAERVFKGLATPSRAGLATEGVALVYWKGEQELYWPAIGEESRVFVKELCEVHSSGEKDCTTWHRVVVRKSRVVLMVKGFEPSSPGYFAGLAQRMVDRIPDSTS
jgi:hypothetical protein